VWYEILFQYCGAVVPSHVVYIQCRPGFLKRVSYCVCKMCNDFAHVRLLVDWTADNMDHSAEHVREMSNTLYKYHLDNFLCDVFIVLPDATEVPAHSVVLSAVSDLVLLCRALSTLFLQIQLC